jgi:hypothetical protein
MTTERKLVDQRDHCPDELDDGSWQGIRHLCTEQRLVARKVAIRIAPDRRRG